MGESRVSTSHSLNIVDLIEPKHHRHTPHFDNSPHVYDSACKNDSTKFFGFSVGDFVAADIFAWSLYRQSKDASAEFQGACKEVLSLCVTIQELAEEAKNDNSILNRKSRGKQQELDTIMRGCTEVLSQLESLLSRYRSPGTENKRAWDRARFSSDDVQACHNKLLVYTSSLTLFLTSLGTGSPGRIQKTLKDFAIDVRTG